VWWSHLSQHVGVEDLEDLVESKFAETLHGVAKEGRSPTSHQSTHTLFLSCQTKSMKHITILLRLNLNMCVGREREKGKRGREREICSHTPLCTIEIES
jgi:hypothetical protein